MNPPFPIILQWATNFAAVPLVLPQPLQSAFTIITALAKVLTFCRPVRASMHLDRALRDLEHKLQEATEAQLLPYPGNSLYFKYMLDRYVDALTFMEMIALNSNFETDSAIAHLHFAT
jgi:hypothetical protein